MEPNADPDDVLPEQRGALPNEAAARNRQRRDRTGRGRAGRLRSWLTALVGLIAIAACYWLFTQTH